MPYTDKEKELEKRRRYYENNKERINERQRNNERRKIYSREYYENHKEAIKEARSVKFACGCGGKYTYNHILCHGQTKRHVTWLNTLQPPLDGVDGR